nr:carbohydrate ABC transporter permease [Cohnella zeiphila]
MTKLIYTLLAVLPAAALALPIVLTLTNSLMTEREIGSNYDWLGKMGDVAKGQQDAFVNLKLLPDWLSFGQYAQLLLRAPVYLHQFWNSVGLSAPIVAGQTAVAALAAYAFAKLKFKGRDKLFLVYLMAMLMPFQVTLVPNYLIAGKLGLLNSWAAIIGPGIFGAFGVFMLRQFMAHIPAAYAEAARMDGAGHGVIFRRIVLPLAKPGLAALIVLLFADQWNMVEQPLIFLEDAFKQPLSVELSRINEQARGVGFAASVLYMIPMALLFLYAEAYLVQGIEQSGIKG